MKKKIAVTIDVVVYEKLLERAKHDKRSVSSLVNVLLSKELE